MTVYKNLRHFNIQAYKIYLNDIWFENRYEKRIYSLKKGVRKCYMRMNWQNIKMPRHRA